MKTQADRILEVLQDGRWHGNDEWGPLGIPWYATSKENLAKVLDLPPQDPAQIHRADYDAWYQAKILTALLDRAPA